MHAREYRTWNARDRHWLVRAWLRDTCIGAGPRVCTIASSGIGIFIPMLSRPRFWWGISAWNCLDFPGSQFTYRDFHTDVVPAWILMGDFSLEKPGFGNWTWNWKYVDRGIRGNLMCVPGNWMNVLGFRLELGFGNKQFYINSIFTTLFEFNFEVSPWISTIWTNVCITLT